MKKTILACLTFGLSICSFGNASAATMDISISGINSLGIETAIVWYDIDSAFSLVGTPVFGDAIPAPKGFGWLTNFAGKSIEAGKDVFKIDLSDWDLLFAPIPSPLQDGKILTFEYTGKILGLNYASFADASAADYYNNTIRLAALNDNLTVFSPVPLPGAVWLLGSGLAGLVALKRKRD